MALSRLFGEATGTFGREALAGDLYPIAGTTTFPEISVLRYPPQVSASGHELLVISLDLIGIYG